VYFLFIIIKRIKHISRAYWILGCKHSNMHT